MGQVGRQPLLVKDMMLVYKSQWRTLEGHTKFCMQQIFCPLVISEPSEFIWCERSGILQYLCVKIIDYNFIIHSQIKSFDPMNITKHWNALQEDRLFGKTQTMHVLSNIAKTKFRQNRCTETNCSSTQIHPKNTFILEMKFQLKFKSHFLCIAYTFQAKHIKMKQKKHCFPLVVT